MIKQKFMDKIKTLVLDMYHDRELHGRNKNSIVSIAVMIRMCSGCLLINLLTT